MEVSFLCQKAGDSMADGTIKIRIEVDGKEVEITSKSLDNLGLSGQKSGKDLKQTEEGINSVGKASKKAGGSVKQFTASLALVKIGESAFKALSSSMDAAISRFDTLNKFPKVLQSLGVSAEDSEKAVQNLSDGIDGLPTKLDDISSTAQRMYTSFSDMDKATDSALALNNALLGSGSSAADAQRGTEQYLKVLQTGKVELDTWNTLSQTMDVALVKVADSFGYTGRSAKQDLYKALQEGIITVDDFNNKLIELGTGTGELAELARVNSLGMATSLSNLKNAASRGIADILQSLNTLSKDATGKEIAEHIDGLKVIVNTAFKVIGRAIESATPIVKGFINVIKGSLPIIEALSPAIAGVMAAYASYKVIEKARIAIETSNRALKVAQASSARLTLAKKAQAGATAAHTVATKAEASAVTLSQLAIGVLTGKIGLATAAKVVATTVTYGLKAALDVLLGPVGLVIAGIALLTAGTIALVKWFKAENEETKRLNAETEKLAETTDNLAKSVENTSQAYKESQNDVKSTAQANKKLAREIESLTKKENKSAAEKMILRDKIEQLNDSVEGLNLSYNEEADALNMSNEQLQGRVDLMAEQTSYNKAMERQIEIEKELQDTQMQIQEVIEKRKEWNEALEDGSVKSRDHKKALEELEEQSGLLGETHFQLTEEYKTVSEEVSVAANNIATTIEDSNLRQITSYEDLSDEQKEAFDNMKSLYEELADAATNAFDRMNDESKATADEMIANLEHNQKMTEEWGKNIAELYERAGEQSIDEGFIKYLEGMGPDAAAEVAEVATMSDTELKKFSELMAEGGKIASESLATALGEGFEEAIEAMSFIDEAELSLRNQITESGFAEIGELLPEGVASGIEKGTEEVAKTSSKMAEEADKAFKKEAEIQSPSKVFERSGEAMTEGLVLGVNNGTSKVLDTVKELLKDMIGKYDGSYASFKSIGENIMAGLNAGLEAGRNSVVAKARNIANEITRTMKQAQGIYSPSRVMRDEIGQMIPAGIGVGIDDAMPKLLGDVDRNMAALTQRMSAGANISSTTTTNNNNNVNHSGTIRVEGVNSQGELMDVVEIIKDELRQEART